ncbi:uncharacterized protein LOC119006642 isoform X7 [Acanthopagrus latus]|uniref:uncharacterized protein LOC119006642 isoform X7 n=1 Tax=Acanthopagrus latus TaxID=8177 RepID=UPI00187CE607|nr:uncharacterized protein LOC119006642 isoform X7 [Acanthopagrus latus]
MSRRRCIFRCKTKFPLNGLPKDEEVKSQWLQFIFKSNTIPQQYSPKLVLCSHHFTEDCFENHAQFKAGYSKRLILREGAVPTVLGSVKSAESGPQPVTAGSSSKIFPAVRHVACQTDLPERLSVGTQVYMKTYFRSKGTQARVASRDCGMCTLTLPLDSPLLFLQPTIIKRPSKRPQLSLTDKEEGPSQCKLSMLAHQPENST